MSIFGGNGIYIRAAGASGGGVTGSGTLNYVPKWTPNGTTLGNSQMYDDGTSVGVNLASGLVAKFSILYTGEQLRLLYDVSNYYSTTVSSAGKVTFDATGASAGFVFNDSVGVGASTLTAKFNIISTNEQFRCGYDTSNYWNATTTSNGSTTLNVVGLNNSIGFTTNTLWLFDRTAIGTTTQAIVTINRDEGTSANAITNGHLVLKSNLAGGTGFGTVFSMYNSNASGDIAINLSGSNNTKFCTIAVGSLFGLDFGISMNTNGGFAVQNSSNQKEFYIDGSYNFAFGNLLTPAAKVHITSGTEQLRIGYDTSNYYKTTVGSTGTVTFDAVGAGAKFVFADGIELTQTVTTEALTSDTSVTIVINNTTYKLLAKA